MLSRTKRRKVDAEPENKKAPEALKTTSDDPWAGFPFAQPPEITLSLSSGPATPKAPQASARKVAYMLSPAYVCHKVPQALSSKQLVYQSFPPPSVEAENPHSSHLDVKPKLKTVREPAAAYMDDTRDLTGNSGVGSYIDEDLN